MSGSALEDAQRDFPEILAPGSFPCGSLRYGPGFARLLEELRDERFAALAGEKFGLDLGGRETMITVRGQCRPTDGGIHRDSKGKIVTVLLYVNGSWDEDGGRLRLLNGPHDLEDYCAEVSPHGGSLVAFPCVENAWHGHKSFAGPRRAIQLNWVRDKRYLRRERRRHAVSAVFKRLGRLLRVAPR